MGAIQPEIRHTRKHESRQSSSSSQQTSSQVQTTPSAAAYLERLARAMIEAVNTRQLEHHPSSRFLDPSIQTFPDDRAPTVGIQQYFDSIRRLCVAYPQHYYQLSDAKAHINLRAGYGDVYLKITVTGLPPGVVRNSVCVMEFRFRNGVWMCVKMTGIHGMTHDLSTTGEDGEEEDG